MIVQILGNAKGLSGELKGASREVDGFGKKLKAGFAAAGVAAAAAVGAAFKAGIDTLDEMQSENRKLQASLGLTGDEAVRFKGLINDVYTSGTGSSIGALNADLANALSSMPELFNKSDAEIKAFLSGVNTISDVFDLETSAVTTAMTRMVKSGLVDTTEEGLDLLTTGFQLIPSTLRENVVEALDEYSPFMDALGLDGPQAMGLLVKAAEKGQYGIDKLGDALKEFTVRATDGSKASVEAYDMIGLSSTKMTKAILGGGEGAKAAFGQIIAGLQGIKDPAAQSGAALALFGTPLEDLSVAEIPAFLASLNTSKVGLQGFQGATEAAAAILYNSFGARLTAVKRTALVGFATYMETTVIPALIRLRAWLKDKVGPSLASMKVAWDDLKTAVSNFYTKNKGTIDSIIASFQSIVATNLDSVIKLVVAAFKTFGAWLEGPQAKAAITVLKLIGQTADTTARSLNDLASMNIGGLLKKGTLGQAGSLLRIPGLAKGGPVTAGSPYIVGEEGPELIVPGRSGRVVSNSDLVTRGGGGGAVGGRVTVTLDVTGADREMKALLQRIVRVEGGGNVQMALGR